VNLAFLERLQLCRTPQEFCEFVSVAGWAVGGQDDSMRRVGVMAKRILDLGRVAWIRETLGLRDASLVDYVNKDVTPENIAIVACG